MASVTINDNPRSPSARARSALAQGDPFVPRMLLGRRLRELREAARLSRRDAGRRLHGSESRITRLELGRTAARPADVARLLAVYGADGDERTLLLALAEQTNARAWWQDDGDIVSRWVRPYLSAEQAAKLVRTFESQYVPGLLQTEDYARAVIRRASPEPEVERRVAFRMRRQRVLRRRPRPLNLWVVLDKAALWRPIGSPATMRDQIRHIVEMCARPNVTVQIAPYGISGRVGCEGPLTLVRFPQQGLQDMVYLERPDNAHYPARRAEIERYWHVFNTLVTEAAPPERTPHILAEMLTTY
ncbi:helix-turn-helix domain-containing protein [Actinomadura madurae]|uniref:helix-turn-helix domain-containing protein n=1 Tax=Actinomadura madurae TaxID=1993 RepID=UPI002026F88A|nr:helix-turn-helix transcriptional regulator [Actinomadura madurae]MCP9953506.1 helix-turn-helix domain-containing protein [Actinomadura madurae]MCP9970265.1 helix-turn-helix domain-containing protein [Actinomadura madurae]MCQ0005716.1 helix-turn-helix domain-containing protein [Actinomadura madurae]URM98991.1 helix-turn-helix domain-containing protein [Actinomadura madurae]URN09681.1 helix-turn-helix domain-containing protein [Actinomadura madurae]